MNPRLAAWEVSVKWICEQIFKNADVFNAFSGMTTVKISIRLGNSTQELLGGLFWGFGIAFRTGGIPRAGWEGSYTFVRDVALSVCSSVSQPWQL